jgi:hypothetical protein
MGFFYRHQAMLIAQYAKKIASVRGFVRVGGAPMLMTAKGTISILPVDYIIWSAAVAELAAANRGAENYGSPDTRARPHGSALGARLEGGPKGRRSARDPQLMAGIDIWRRAE